MGQYFLLDNKRSKFPKNVSAKPVEDIDFNASSPFLMRYPSV
jgi:hypothetical protein